MRLGNSLVNCRIEASNQQGTKVPSNSQSSLKDREARSRGIDGKLAASVNRNNSQAVLEAIQEHKRARQMYRVLGCLDVGSLVPTEIESYKVKTTEQFERAERLSSAVFDNKTADHSRDTGKFFSSVTEEEFIAGQTVTYFGFSGQDATAKYTRACSQTLGVGVLRVNGPKAHEYIYSEAEARQFFFGLSVGAETTTA
jgi:hypothetical protein